MKQLNTVGSESGRLREPTYDLGGFFRTHRKPQSAWENSSHGRLAINA